MLEKLWSHGNQSAQELLQPALKPSTRKSQQGYASTNEADDEDKDTFYQLLSQEVSKAKEREMVIVTGDINAKVGDNNVGYE